MCYRYERVFYWNNGMYYIESVKKNRETQERTELQ